MKGLKMQIAIDFTDKAEQWYGICTSEEFDFNSPIIATELALTGLYGRKQIAEILITARELGYMSEESFRSNKVNLIAGTELNVKGMIESNKAGYKVGRNGKIVRFKQAVNVFHSDHGFDATQDDNVFQSQIGDVTQDDSGQSHNVHYAPTQSELAKQSARDYVLKAIPNHLFKYFTIYAINDGDVKELAKELKREIDKVVKIVLKED